jgi:hypothetical protein
MHDSLSRTFSLVSRQDRSGGQGLWGNEHCLAQRVQASRVVSRREVNSGGGAEPIADPVRVGLVVVLAAAAPLIAQVHALSSLIGSGGARAE